MRIGFIGSGRITRRLVGGIAGQGHEISLTRRSERVSSELAAAHDEITVVTDAQSVVDRSEMVFVCLAAEVARELLQELRFAPDQTVVSVMARMPLEELRSIAAPASDVCVTIPMPLVEHGGCPLPVHPHCPALETVLGGRNPLICVASDAALAPFWALSGSMASVLAELRTLSTWLGERIDDPIAAERYVTHLYGGYLGTLDKDGAGRIDSALSDLAIAGGLNATLLEHITQAGHYEDLRAGLDALYGQVRTD